ncbi:MAG: hypothetical protein WCA35_08850 [Kovacikia sp.]
MTVAENLNSDVSIYKEIIAIPLEKGKEKDFSGGLVDSRHLQLVEKAIHRHSSNSIQELSYVGSGDDFGKKILRVEKYVFFGGILFNHFGHFLVESLGRLWAYEAFRQLDPYIFSIHPGAYLII